MEVRRILYRDDRMIARLEEGWVVSVYFKIRWHGGIGYNYTIDGEKYRLFEQ